MLLKSLIFDNLECHSFHDVVGTGNTIEGVEVFVNGERKGEIIGEDLPDEDEVFKFTERVETWLIDNDY